MNKPINLLVGGLTLFAAQGCKAPKQASQQAEHPNIIYVFPHGQEIDVPLNYADYYFLEGLMRKRDLEKK